MVGPVTTLVKGGLWRVWANGTTDPQQGGEAMPKPLSGSGSGISAECINIGSGLSCVKYEEKRDAEDQAEASGTI